jgi:rhodanese-related sulfurtransferase
MKQRIILISFLLLLGLASYFFTRPSQCTANCGKSFEIVTPVEFQKLTAADNAVVVDLRTPEEFASGHLTTAKNIDFYNKPELDSFLNTSDKNAHYLLYCRSGNRSGQTAKIMEQKGFTNVIDLAGGIETWKAAGLSF